MLPKIAVKRVPRECLRTYFSRPEARQAIIPQVKWSMAKYVSSRISQRTRMRRNRFIQPCVRSTTQAAAQAASRRTV